MFGLALLGLDPDTAGMKLTKRNKKPGYQLYKMVLFFPAKGMFFLLKATYSSLFDRKNRYLNIKKL
jgi:hypothetical protein